MNKLLSILVILVLFSFDLSGQSKSGFIISSNYSIGNLIDGEKNPRVESAIASGKFQLDYSIVNWDHTIMRLGVGYQILKCRDSRIGYMQFPIVFQRFIKANKTGFNTSLVLMPSYYFGEKLELCNNKNIQNFNIEIAIRAGKVFERNNHKYSLEFEATVPMGSIQKFGIMKYIVYGVKVGYYI